VIPEDPEHTQSRSRRSHDPLDHRRPRPLVARVVHVVAGHDNEIDGRPGHGAHQVADRGPGPLRPADVQIADVQDPQTLQVRRNRRMDDLVGLNGPRRTRPPERHDRVVSAVRHGVGWLLR